jgi:translation initiation factor IF-3
MNKFNKDKHTSKTNVLANHAIKFPELRVVTADGEALGIMPTTDALREAQSRNQDLVVTVLNAKPPVAKIIELNKYNYELKKREKEAAKSARANIVDVKEVKFRPAIGEHDLQNKMKQAQKFIDKGAKVKLTIQMRGRENSKARDVLEFFKNQVEKHLEKFKFDAPLKLNGNRIIGVITKNE